MYITYIYIYIGYSDIIEDVDTICMIYVKESYKYMYEYLWYVNTGLALMYKVQCHRYIEFVSIWVADKNDRKSNIASSGLGIQIGDEDKLTRLWQVTIFSD